MTFKHVTFKKIVYFHLITKYIIAKHDKIIIAFYKKQHLNMLLFWNIVCHEIWMSLKIKEHNIDTSTPSFSLNWCF